MKIKAILELAQMHFAMQQYSSYIIWQILWRYALDELRLPDQDISKWVFERQVELKAGHQIPSYRDFYLWYYGNYVPTPPEDGWQAPQTPSNPAGFKKELLITRYVVIKVKALVEEDSVEDAIKQWESAWHYDLPGIDGFVIRETEFMGTTEIYPDLCQIRR